MSGIGFVIVLAGLAILLLQILAIVDVIRSPIETAMKILWVILIIWLPAIGPILYYLLGRARQSASS